MNRPESFESWSARQNGDPEEIGFLQALRIAYLSGQDSVLSAQPAVTVNARSIRALKSSLNFVTDVANDKRPSWGDLFDELEAAIAAAEQIKGGAA